ncbi:hypothetical protein ACFVQB_21220 [Paenibacillus sp. NPDC057886]|uniref:hypothetical protein n=1 Tax=Paenibacillus sp. NPDC057886 TaxID=3346270 RepID=UPI003695AEFE
MILLDGMTDLKGSEVLLDGLIKMPVTVEDLEPVPEAPFVSEVQVEEEPEEEKKGFWDKVLDVTQTVLDVAGMNPVIREVRIWRTRASMPPEGIIRTRHY